MVKKIAGWALLLVPVSIMFFYTLPAPLRDQFLIAAIFAGVILLGTYLTAKE